jgi:hypothetical protein
VYVCMDGRAVVVLLFKSQQYWVFTMDQAPCLALYMHYFI